MRTGFHALYSIVPAGLATAFHQTRTVAVPALIQTGINKRVFNMCRLDILVNSVIGEDR